MTRTDLLSQLAVLLGGRSAEEIAFGEISTGAQNDLQRATDIARAMVTEFGMSDALGVVNYNGHKRNAFLDTPFMQERGNYAEETALKIDTEVKRILTEAHDEARRILRDHRQRPRRAVRAAARKGSHRGRGAQGADGADAAEGPRRPAGRDSASRANSTSRKLGRRARRILFALLVGAASGAAARSPLHGSDGRRCRLRACLRRGDWGPDSRAPWSCLRRRRRRSTAGQPGRSGAGAASASTGATRRRPMSRGRS